MDIACPAGKGAVMAKGMIDGVVIKELLTHTDERGFFREIIRVTDPFFKDGFGQLSVSKVDTGVIKAWHIHYKQAECIYVSRGKLKVALYDARKNSPTYKNIIELSMGEGERAVVVSMPPGVAHGYRCVNGPADVFYIASRVYDPADEGRIPHDDPEIGYVW